jgi:ribose 1,5-bisphosphokinase
MAGRLIYLMGPSGSGKDSLLDAMREPWQARGGRIARRVITRSAEAVGEEAHAVTPERFARLEAQGAFAMSWRANGLAYGIPRELDDWLEAGQNVLVNGSRGYLPQARQRYPQMLAILLSVRPEVLRQRLLARGRETPEEIEQRLARSLELQAGFDEGQGEVLLLDNSAALAQTLERLLGLIGEPRPQTRS